MKLTEIQLKRIIKESVLKVIGESRWTDGSNELYTIDREDDELMDSESDDDNWRKFRWHVLHLVSEHGVESEDVTIEGELYDPATTPYGRNKREKGLGLEAPHYPNSPVTPPVDVARNVTIKYAGAAEAHLKPRTYRLTVAKMRGGTMLQMAGKLADTGEVQHFRFTFDE